MAFRKESDLKSHSMKIRVYDTTGASQSTLSLQKLVDQLNVLDQRADEDIEPVETQNERSRCSLSGTETAILELIKLNLTGPR